MILVMEDMRGMLPYSAITVPTLTWQPSDRGIAPLYARLQLGMPAAGGLSNSRTSQGGFPAKLPLITSYLDRYLCRTTVT